MSFKRRVPLWTLVALVLSSAAVAGPAHTSKKVVVLGFDGMDHELTSRLMAEGRLPNMSRLAKEGTYAPLGTAVPPQSPVAWSNFITGSDAGGHGIFDFVHREPETMTPYLSTSRTHDAEKMLKVGKYQIPLSSGTIELLRHGEAFWEELESHGVETTIVRIPANFPPSGTATRELSGMGTPDITGTYGLFSFFTSDASPYKDKDIGGGKVYEVKPGNGVVETRLYGGTNPFYTKRTKAHAELKIYIDAEADAAKVVVGPEERVLRVGEWSDWVRIEMPLIPLIQSYHGIARFYLKQVRPVFQLYVSPINIDPLSPDMPISTPPDFAAELARETGLFYTQGMMEDTSALTAGVLTRDEFLEQADLAGKEVEKQYEYLLGKHERGLLFYYFGNLDQISHMMWRPLDPEHPAYDAEEDEPYADVIPQIYEEFDAIVGYTLEHMDPDTTLIVMSDHGFTSWRRSLNLNTWLAENGYLAVKPYFRGKDPGYFAKVDWSRTRAYNLGINALYINVKGREKYGIVDPGDRKRLIDEIADKLLASVDPATGKRAVTKVYKREDYFEDKGRLEIGPDMVVGYAKGMRGSNDSGLGKVPEEVFVDNNDPWSGDHCMDHEAVPGILATNRPLKRAAPSLDKLAASILAEFGIDGFGGHD